MCLQSGTRHLTLENLVYWDCTPTPKGSGWIKQCLSNFTCSDGIYILIWYGSVAIYVLCYIVSYQLVFMNLFTMATNSNPYYCKLWLRRIPLLCNKFKALSALYINFHIQRIKIFMYSIKLVLVAHVRNLLLEQISRSYLTNWQSGTHKMLGVY